MKDVAEHFGVSLNTVHKAINGKAGVSTQTREKIVNYAKAHGYRVNSAASALKRKKMSMTVCLPELDSDSKYFYSYIWKGYRRYVEEWGDRTLQFQEITYGKGGLSDSLVRLVEEAIEKGWPDGVLTQPPTDERGAGAIRRLTGHGTAVVFVTGDMDECGRLGAVVGDYHAAGRIMAEQMKNILKPESRILLMTGDRYKDAHYLIAKGFHEYMEQNEKKCRIEELGGYRELDRLQAGLRRIFAQNPPDAVCCVFARGSVILAEELRKSGLAGKLPAIANDIFEENAAALADGTFTNLVFKAPEQQSYMAAKMLGDYLLNGIIPAEPLKKVEVSLIFAGNLKYFYGNCDEKGEGQ